MGDESSARGEPSAGDVRRMQVRMLGPLAIHRDGVAVALPASRKLRALIAYLALAPRPVGRGRLCDLLWDLPDDPRGELRWCLSKARAVLDDGDRRRVGKSGDAVALDLSDCFVDVLEIGRAVQEGIDRLGPERLRALAALFVGDFLEGLEIDRSPEFSAWVTAQRCRLRACRAAVLEHLLASLPPESDEVFDHLDEWLQIAPFDRRAHALLLNTLAVRERIGEGDAHLARVARLFEDEGLDAAPLRESWRLARSRARVRGGPEPDAPAMTLLARDVPAAGEAGMDARRRASIAVMPFTDWSGEATTGGLADALAHDIVTRLARLRHLFVIAYGTTSALGARSLGTEEAGRLLNVDYVAGGSLRRGGGRVVVTVELSEARSARVVWADEFDRKEDDTLGVLDEIGDRIVAAMTGEIELAERNRAVLKPPSSLTAWEAYHRGLWHVYRYEAQHNRLAEEFFEMAVRLDPTWARALSALSFTHFQNAFQRWTEREHEIDLAVRTAEQSLVADERDPSAHWAMGRALWLRGHHAQCLPELEKAVELSPSFAHGHYTLAFVHVQSGDPRYGVDCVDHSRRLSPFDPLLCVMLAARAIALVRLGRFDEAADWALKAIGRPNAFPHLRALAGACLALAGREQEGRAVVAVLRAARPRYRVDDLLTAFRFAPEAAELFRRGARDSALD